MSKLDFDGRRVDVAVEEAMAVIASILTQCGCSNPAAHTIAEHLCDASLSGIESHGLMRVLQYNEQFRSGYMQAGAAPKFQRNSAGHVEIDGQDCIGILSMELAIPHGCELAHRNGISAIAVRNTGHTGRLGAFAEKAALDGFMTIIIGGGNRRNWRQVAPHGGKKALLPTNPYCIGIPGGDHGPVVLDFATSKIAGGWIYAARSAGARLPDGVMIDASGKQSTDPEDFFKGGAILPAGEAKGYALALVAEIIAEAMLGPSTTECNWLMITLNTASYRDPSRMQEIAEEILAECRDCPPAPGFERVEVPGERERDCRRASNGVIAIPEQTWQQILALQSQVG